MLEILRTQVARMIEAGETDTAREFLRNESKSFMVLAECHKCSGDHTTAWSCMSVARKLERFADTI